MVSANSLLVSCLYFCLCLSVLNGFGIEATVVSATKEKEKELQRHRMNEHYVTLKNGLSKEVCEKVMEMATMTRTPWRNDADSIDGYDQDCLDIFDENPDNSDFTAREIHDYLKPHLDTLQTWAEKSLNSGKLKISWIFLRRYTAGGARSSLVPHTDTNYRTINIALNQDYEGGTLYFIEPKSELERELMTKKVSDNKIAKRLTQEVLDYVTINHPDIYAPPIEQGLVLLHGNHLEHGIMDVTRNIRYSLIVFFVSDDPDKIKECELKKGMMFDRYAGECNAVDAEILLSYKVCVSGEHQYWDERSQDCFCEHGYVPDFDNVFFVEGKSFVACILDQLEESIDGKEL